MDSLGAPQTLLGWAGWGVSLLVALFAYLANRRKGDVDEATLILGKYKDMVDAHEHAVSRLQDQVEAAAERERARDERELEARKSYNDELDALRGRIRALEDENAGLKRQLAQRSQSVAQRLDMSDSPATAAAMRRRSDDAGIDGIMDQLRHIGETPEIRAAEMKARGVKPVLVVKDGE